jgi:hypothetical protein
MISSMAPFINFLKEHQEVKSCDFKDMTVVQDVETLAQYLKDPQCAVTLLKIKTDISDQGKDSLKAAETARQGAFTVQYV